MLPHPAYKPNPDLASSSLAAFSRSCSARPPPAAGGTSPPASSPRVAVGGAPPAAAALASASSAPPGAATGLSAASALGAGTSFSKSPLTTYRGRGRGRSRGRGRGRCRGREPSYDLQGPGQQLVDTPRSPSWDPAAPWWPALHPSPLTAHLGGQLEQALTPHCAPWWPA